jgi:hypothetical protein
MAYKWAKDMSAKYVEIGADGERWTLGNSPPEFTTELEEQPGYASVPIHIGPCMMAGAAAAYYVLHNQEPVNDQLAEWSKLDNRRASQLRMVTVEDQPLPTANTGTGIAHLTEIANYGLPGYVERALHGVGVDVTPLPIAEEQNEQGEQAQTAAANEPDDRPDIFHTEG